jgi:ribose-phosphate pyrophosphokinase
MQPARTDGPGIDGGRGGPASRSTVLAFAEHAAAADAFAALLDAPRRTIHARRFPDGESLVTLELPPGDRAIIHCTLGQPNARLVELMLAASTAREHGARHLTLVAPYLCYMRQDMAFRDGEAVSQRIVGGFLASLFDAVVTVDAHLHRVATLAEAVPLATAVNATAAEAIAGFVANHAPGALLVGPDIESGQWVSRIARASGLDSSVCEKSRRGDRAVEVTLHGDVTDRHVVLVDDIASSGQTLVQAALACRRAGADRIDAIVTHAMSGEADMAAMREAGIGRFWSTDSLPHPSNAVPLAPVLADACRLHGLA